MNPRRDIALDCWRTALRRLAAIGACLAVGALAASPAAAAVVTVNFTAYAPTVSGNPFGLQVALNTVGSGFFRYDTAVPDSDPDPDQGRYEHAANGAFSITFTDVHSQVITVTGSAVPVLAVGDSNQGGGKDLFRFMDGRNQSSGTMSLNGVGQPDASLWISMVPPADTFDSPALPDVFPYIDPSSLVTAHTFSLTDTGAPGDTNGTQGTILWQFTSIPEPATAALLAAAAFWAIRRRRRRTA